MYIQRSPLVLYGGGGGVKTTKTITDLNAKFQQRVKKLTEEYDYQRLQAQTFADYSVALLIAYEQERARINGR